MHKCEANFLIERDSEWPHDIQLLGYYQYRTRTHLQGVYRLGNLTVANTTVSVRQPWLSGTFPLQKAHETERNQLCLNFTSDEVHYTKDVHLCRHVPVVECCACQRVVLIALICLSVLATSL